MAPKARHDALESLRVELYAITSVIAEGAVERAYESRELYPPYGLVRSGHVDMRMVKAAPEPVEEGAIASYFALGRAYVDTMVFHLANEFTALKASDKAWMVRRLEDLLVLFRIDAGPTSKGRVRDGLSFVYGGLHFGAGVSVQLAEMMTRLLAPFPGLGAEERAAVMARSSRPAHRFAALNFDHVIVAYDDFLGPPDPSTPIGQRWFDAGKFVVQVDDAGRPQSIDIRADELVAGKPHTAKLAAGRPTTYATHGCPARISPSGGTAPITRLWTWSVELASEAGLLTP